MTDLGTALHDAVDLVESTEVLDPIAERVAPLVDSMTRSNRVKRALSGTPIGHRLHPLLTDIPIGCWTTSSLLDMVAWRSGERSAQFLTGLGVAAALPTMATGLSDWRDTNGASRRLGLVHMALNGAGFACEVASWRARRRRHHAAGAMFGLMGMAVASAAGYLGGHLVYSERVGVDVEVPVVEDDEWHPACSLEEIDEVKPTVATIGEARIVLIRVGEGIRALAAPCTHQGGPLHEHDVSDGTLTCSWHGSKFCVSDGHVERGPATTGLTVYEARERDGWVDVRTVKTT